MHCAAGSIRLLCPVCPGGSLVARQGAKRRKKRKRILSSVLSSTPALTATQTWASVCLVLVQLCRQQHIFHLFLCVCVNVFFRNTSCFAIAWLALAQAVKCRHSHGHVLCDALLHSRLIFPPSQNVSTVVLVFWYHLGVTPVFCAAGLRNAFGRLDKIREQVTLFIAVLLGGVFMLCCLPATVVVVTSCEWFASMTLVWCEWGCSGAWALLQSSFVITR